MSTRWLRAYLFFFASLFFVLMATASPTTAVTSGKVVCSGVSCAGLQVAAYVPETERERFARLSAGTRRQPLASASVDESGRFALQLASGRVVDLCVTGRDLLPAGTRVASGASDVVLVAQPAASVAGRVVSAAGKPVPNAKVLWWSDSAELSTPADADGAFAAPDPRQWNASVAVLAAGLAPYVDRGAGSHVPSANITLEEGVTVRGTSAARAGSRITVDGWPRGVAGENGQIAIEHAPAQWTEIAVDDGERTFVAEPAAAGASRFADARLRVEGTAEDAASHQPLRSARVELRLPDGRALERLTDDRGRFVFRLTIWEGGAIAVDAPGYKPLLRPLTSYVPRPLTLPLSEGATVRGVVRGERGAVAGAFVTLQQRARWVAVRSDAAGRFVARGLDPALPIAVLAGDGAGSVAGVEATTSRFPAAITVGGPVRYAGTVVDAAGKPVANARVTLARDSAPSPDSFPPAARTSAGGAFEIHTSAGRHTLVVRAPGMTAATAGPLGESRDDLRVSLAPAVALAGEVRREGGEPVRAATVRLRGPHGASLLSTTAADGSFLFRDIDAGAWQVDVVKATEFVRAQRRVTAAVESARANVRLPDGDAFGGRVTNQHTGQPVTSFELFSRITTGAGEPLMVLRTVDDPDGAFALRHVPPGAAHLVVQAAGFIDHIIKLAPNERAAAKSLAVALALAKVLSGRVVDDAGLPLAGVEVAMLRTSDSFLPLAVSGSDGRYRLDRLEENALTLRFSKRGFAPASQRVTLGDAPVTLDVRLSRGASLRGHVVTAAGALVSGAEVSLTTVGGEPIDSAQSGDDGAFELSGLMHGEYTVTAAKLGRAAGKVSPVTRQAAEGPPLSVVMLDGGSIAGRISGVSESDWPDIRVTAQAGSEQFTTATDAGGMYRLDAVPPGDVRVRAWFDRPGQRATNIVLVELQDGGQATADLAFENAARIEGRVTFQSRPCTVCTVRFWSYSVTATTNATLTTDADGSYVAEALAPGEYNVTVLDPKSFGHFEKRYSVVDDARFDIVVAGAAIRGMVVDDESGAPIPHALIFSESIDQPVASGRPSTMADSAGAFELSPLAPGTYRMRVQARGYGESVATLDVGETGMTHDVRLLRSDGVTVTVVDAATKQQLPALLVVRNAAGQIVFEDMLRGDGVPVNVPLGVGHYEAAAYARGYAPGGAQFDLPGPAVTVGVTVGGKLDIASPFPERRSARLLRNGVVYHLNPYLRADAFVLNPGDNVYDNVAPGSYTLLVADAAGLTWQELRFTVTDGAATSVRPSR